jgi:MFS family permease
MHHLTGKWIPPNERSKFVSAYQGNSIGIAIAYPLFGFVIKASSWEWAFHLCGIAGVIWYMFWLYFVSFVTQSLAVLMIKSSQGLRLSRETSPHPPERKGIHPEDSRIVGHARQ